MACLRVWVTTSQLCVSSRENALQPLQTRKESRNEPGRLHLRQVSQVSRRKERLSGAEEEDLQSLPKRREVE